MACQYLVGTIFPSQPLIFVKKVSNVSWNCDGNLRIYKLNTKSAVLACIGEIPKYIPGVIVSFCLLKVWYAAKGRDNTYTRQKSGCQCLGLESTLNLLNICIVVGV